MRAPTCDGISPVRAVGEQAPVALPPDLPAHLADALVADLAEGDPVVTGLGHHRLAMRMKRGR